MKTILSLASAAVVAVMLSACSGATTTYSDTPYEDRTAGRGTAVYGAKAERTETVRETTASGEAVYNRTQNK